MFLDTLHRLNLRFLSACIGRAAASQPVAQYLSQRYALRRLVASVYQAPLARALTELASRD